MIFQALREGVVVVFGASLSLNRLKREWRYDRKVLQRE